MATASWVLLAYEESTDHVMSRFVVLYPPPAPIVPKVWKCIYNESQRINFLLVRFIEVSPQYLS